MLRFLFICFWDGDRSANSEKDAFRRDPTADAVCIFQLISICTFTNYISSYIVFNYVNFHNGAMKVKHLSYMQTARGTKLLTSGWWGAARKINYTGKI